MRAKIPLAREGAVRYDSTAVNKAAHAGVAELADAYGSGPYGGNPVEVQVLSPAPLSFRNRRQHACDFCISVRSPRHADCLDDRVGKHRLRPARPLPHMRAAPPSPSRPLPHIRAQMQTTPRELSRRDLLQVGPEPAVLGVERVERLVSEAFALQTPGRHGHAVVAGQHVRAHRPRTTSLKRFPFTLAKGASVSYSSSGVSYSSSVNRMTADALAFRRRPRPPAGVLALRRHPRLP